MTDCAAECWGYETVRNVSSCCTYKLIKFRSICGGIWVCVLFQVEKGAKCFRQCEKKKNIVPEHLDLLFTTVLLSAPLSRACLRPWSSQKRNLTFLLRCFKLTECHSQRMFPTPDSWSTFCLWWYCYIFDRSYLFYFSAYETGKAAMTCPCHARIWGRQRREKNNCQYWKWPLQLSHGSSAIPMGTSNS